jgi:hypothetical protein
MAINLRNVHNNLINEIVVHGPLIMPARAIIDEKALGLVHAVARNKHVSLNRCCHFRLGFHADRGF